MTIAAENTAQIYIDLMSEIKVRLQFINRCLNKTVAFPVFEQEYLVVETVMIQVRMICEMIAVACLVAHESNPKKDLRKAYSATRIFRSLEDLKPDFFPRPVAGAINPKTGILDYVDVAGALGQNEIGPLYEYCNSDLHRAKYNDVISREKRIYRSDYLFRSARQLAILLDTHLIQLSMPAQMAIVQMHGPFGHVHWTTYNALPDDR